MEQKLDSKITNLLDIIQHTEYVTTKIHGVFDKEEIFRIVYEELKKSKQYHVILLLLSDDKRAFNVKFVTIPEWKLKLVEKVIRMKISDFKMDYEKTTVLHRVIEKAETYFFNTMELVKQVLPSPIGHIVAKITGHDKKTTTVTPIKIGNKIIGVFAIDSPDSIELTEYYSQSVKNIAQHISVALELAEENGRRKKAEEKLLILNQNLDKKNKELEQFAYITSHDLNEPLRTINGLIQLIAKEGKLEGDVKQYFEFIEQAANRMSALIKSVLDYSRLDNNSKLTQVNCNAILNDILIDLGAVIKENQAKIEFENLPVLNAYPVEIKQLFQNLIVNAIKFRKKEVSPEITITVKKENSDWIFAVKDNGIGIDLKYKNKIFQIFQRLHNRNQYEGLGIGLAFCKKISELHNGKIWVESKEGEWSTFYFSISDLLIVQADK